MKKWLERFLVKHSYALHFRLKQVILEDVIHRLANRCSDVCEGNGDILQITGGIFNGYFKRT